MSGHSHWSGIKHKKEITDKKRAVLFSKLLNAVAIAAKNEPNPQFNPRLRTVIEKAKANNVPLANIERAIKKAAETKDLEELIIEAYGPAGAAIIINAVSDNKNRTISEIRKILADNNAKIAEPGSVIWSFEQPPASSENQEWRPKFKQTINPEDKNKLDTLIQELEERDDIQKVYTNM
ncbi:MAG: YebC/PmpR family DNA-binding transcriptional regulator [Candidatus Brennerbacteria bacterium]|nr:YebC/PmpR family DNA-binding transcriptional regulator [Candidatus Brennerbacteria bacterium]